MGERRRDRNGRKAEKGRERVGEEMGEEKEKKERENTNCDNELLKYDIIIVVWIRYFIVSRKNKIKIITQLHEFIVVSSPWLHLCYHADLLALAVEYDQKTQ
jgi:hypothetical protein